MKAAEKNINDDNRTRAMGSIVGNAPYSDPNVVEAFNRPPYWPVMNFGRRREAHEGPSRWEED